MMCVGAIVHARVKRVVYGALDPKAGAVVSAFEIGSTQKLNHKVLYEGGVLEKQCGQILSNFFQARRK
jgi:tRNA(adenine34) deaminase